MTDEPPLPLKYTLNLDAERYYRDLNPMNPDQARIESALSDAKTRIDEWSYEQDPHGYCHDRTDWIALLIEIQRLRSLLVAEGIGDEDWDYRYDEEKEDEPTGLIDVRGRGIGEKWVLTCSKHGELGTWPIVYVGTGIGATEPEIAWNQHVAGGCT